MLEIKNISVVLGCAKVLDQFSLRIHTGEFVTVLGKSGCGKSTLLKAINGFVFYEEGSIYLDNACIDDMPVHKRGIVMVFQDVRLFPHLSVWENVAFGLKMQGVNKRERKEKALDWIEKVALTGLENRKPNELSGGQQQRVALARAYAANPRVLLMDEPFSGLDEEIRLEMGCLVQELNKQNKTTVLFVTHDREEAYRLSDRVVVIGVGEGTHEKSNL